MHAYLHIQGETADACIRRISSEWNDGWSEGKVYLVPQIQEGARSGDCGPSALLDRANHLGWNRKVSVGGVRKFAVALLRGDEPLTQTMCQILDIHVGVQAVDGGPALQTGPDFYTAGSCVTGVAYGVVDSMQRPSIGAFVAPVTIS